MAYAKSVRLPRRSLCPSLPALPQERTDAPLTLSDDATLFNPSRKSVFVAEIGLGGIPHDSRSVQPFPLPCEAAFDHPSQDSRPFSIS